VTVSLCAELFIAKGRDTSRRMTALLSALAEIGRSIRELRAPQDPDSHETSSSRSHREDEVSRRAAATLAFPLEFQRNALDGQVMQVVIDAAEQKSASDGEYVVLRFSTRMPDAQRDAAHAEEFMSVVLLASELTCPDYGRGGGELSLYELSPVTPDQVRRRDRLPAHWLNIYGSDYAALLGIHDLLRAPAWRVSPMANGAIVLALGQHPSLGGDAAEAKVAKHLRLPLPRGYLP